MAIEILRPSAPGSETGIDYQYPAGGANWDKVAEISADDDSSFVENKYSAPGTWQRDLYKLPARAGSVPVNFITVYVRTRHNASAAKAIIRTHGVVYEGPEVGSSEWMTLAQQWPNNPFTGLAWTWDEISDLEIGVALSGSTATPDWSRCTQVYLEIDYGNKETLRPNAPGDQCNITDQAGDACPNHYRNVDDVNPDENATYVHAGNIPNQGWSQDLYHIENHGIGVGRIEQISLYARLRASGFYPFWGACRMQIKTGGAVYTLRQVGSSYGASPTTSYTTYQADLATNPQTGKPWTWDEIDSLQIGIEVLGDWRSGYKADTWCTQLYLDVYYARLKFQGGLNVPLTEVMLGG